MAVVASLAVVDADTATTPNLQKVVWDYKIARGVLGGRSTSELLWGVLSDGTPILCDRSFGHGHGGSYVALPLRFQVTAS